MTYPSSKDAREDSATYVELFLDLPLVYLWLRVATNTSLREIALEVVLIDDIVYTYYSIAARTLEVLGRTT